ncbi:MAG: arginase [Armatimonadetes bacterium]|nr:arginase [Armatimonadota bacterium]MBS1729052.1 arginase [Armatimonadota bacterium]
MIEIHGAPFDLGGARQGSRLGPDALRLAGLIPSLSSTGQTEIVDLGNLPTDLHAEAGPGIPFAKAAGDVIVQIKELTSRIVDRGSFPIMLGGEHSMAAGPIAALLDRYGDELAVLWIDAHADLNYPGISPSMNIHGMPLALLAGLSSGMSGAVDQDWNELKERVVGHTLKLDQVCWFGLRDVDPGEKQLAKQGFPITMHEIDRYGVLGCWGKIDERLRKNGCKYLYISLDVDAMDPILAPGTGTAVRGGLTYREAHFLAELICQSLNTPDGYILVGMDVVEVSPIHDRNNETATVAAEWVASLFGKSILG